MRTDWLGGDFDLKLNFLQPHGRFLSWVTKKKMQLEHVILAILHLAVEELVFVF